MIGAFGESCGVYDPGYSAANYLRRNGYVFVARNYVPRGAKGEIDLIGYNRKTLAFVEARTRTGRYDHLDLAPGHPSFCCL